MLIAFFFFLCYCDVKLYLIGHLKGELCHLGEHFRKLHWLLGIWISKSVLYCKEAAKIVRGRDPENPTKTPSSWNLDLWQYLKSNFHASSVITNFSPNCQMKQIPEWLVLKTICLLFFHMRRDIYRTIYMQYNIDTIQRHRVFYYVLLLNILYPY